jgi:N-acetylmuramoyl-L-alanine amidase
MLSTLVAVLLAQTGDFNDLARRLDLQPTCDAVTGRHSVQVGGKTIAFAPGLRSYLVNSAVFPLSSPVTVENGNLRLPPELLRHLEGAPPRSPVPLAVDLGRPVPVQPPPVRPDPARPRKLPPCVIVIDPGHGGMHTGGKGRTGLLEKDINLDVSLELREILEGWGARVVMTRTTDRHFDRDVDDDLNARVDIVNRSGADLFLSVHTNYVANAGPRGFEVWVPRTSGARDRKSRDLARILLDELGQVWDSENRGVKDEHNLRVLKGTTCPAALVELEFVSNPQAERQLAKPVKRRELAEALAEAVRKWVLRQS